MQMHNFKLINIKADNAISNFIFDQFRLISLRHFIVTLALFSVTFYIQRQLKDKER
ncbi:hypothetical protein THZG08_320020 [Vibrio owensii]|nr:hypothetical protein THZG08_320020 [Vibrio owensii]CAH1530074.1 hypothetical protein THF5H11_100163 [Vibrio jasicida]CAH1571029.1 hypothetical protein THOA03_320020 [Vibrio owensii]